MNASQPDESDPTAVDYFAVFVTFAVIAIFSVIVFTALGLAAKQVEPGDTLWPVTEVLWPEDARSVESTGDRVPTEWGEPV